MKKFLLYLLVLVFMISFVGLIFYLTRPDETISANSEVIYLNVGEQSTPNFLVENEKKSTTITVKTSDENVIQVENDKLIANGKGMAIVTFSLKNARQREQIVQQKIYVGDGSEEYPFYIRNEADLANIGTKYAKTAYFRQTSDITLTKEFSMIEGEFSGAYDGNSHVISGYKQTGEKECTAMFETITGKFGYVTFDGVDLNGSFENASVVAKTNNGLIDYVEVKGKIVNTSLFGSCAAIVINNKDAGQIQRCVTKVNIVTSGKIAAGIAAYNNAVITSCQNGDTATSNPINSNFEFVTDEANGIVCGGIVAKNEFVDEDQTKIANNYSVNQILTRTENVYWFDGTSWVKLTKSEEAENVYLSDADEHFIINKEASENGLFIDKNENGVFDEGTDVVLSVWNSATAPTENQIKFTDNCKIGGIVGADYAAGTTYVEQNVKSTPCIYGNYYLITSNFDLAKRGIGNISSTIPNGEKYVANGLPYSVIASPENSIFVSYAITFQISGIDYDEKLKSWPNDVWVLDSSIFPYLIPADQVVNKFEKLNVEIPTLVIDDETIVIDSSSKYIMMAENGVFTDESNTGKTYYIVADLDFENFSFVMVGSEERPVVVNFDGTGCTIKNVKITKSTRYHDGVTLSKIEDVCPANVGFFGVVKESTLDGFNLKNCAFNATGDIAEAKNIGGFAGKAIDCEIKNSSFTSDINSDGSYASSINITADSENAGSIVAVATGCAITNCFAEIEIGFSAQLTHENRLYVGGIVAVLGADKKSTLSQSAFNGKILSNMNESVYVGAAAGLVEVGSEINTFKATNAKINSNFVGGIAAVNKSSIKNSSVRTIIGAKNAGGFVYITEGAAIVENCYCETEFTESSAETNAGMAVGVSKESHFTNCVNVNKFHNDGDAGKNYSRMKQNVKFEFVLSNGSEGKIDELNEYGSGYAYDEIIITNCFYVNSIYNEKTNSFEDSNDYNKTTFYMQTNASPAGAIFGANHVDDKVSIFRTWYNGTLRNGRLKLVGGLAAGPDTDITWEGLGFSSSIWSNADNRIMNSTLYIA